MVSGGAILKLFELCMRIEFFAHEMLAMMEFHIEQSRFFP